MGRTRGCFPIGDVSGGYVAVDGAFCGRVQAEEHLDAVGAHDEKVAPELFAQQGFDRTSPRKIAELLDIAEVALEAGTSSMD